MADKPQKGKLNPPPVNLPPVGNYHALGYYSRDRASKWVTGDTDPACFLGETTGDMYIDAGDHLQMVSKVYRHNVKSAVTQYFCEVDRKVQDNEIVYIQGSNTIHCNANQTVDIVTNHALSTAASQTTDVALGQEIIINGGRTLEVAGNLTETIVGDHKVKVQGNQTQTVNGQRVETSNSSWDQKILGSFLIIKGSTENLYVASSKIGFSYATEVSATIGFAEKASLSAETLVTLGKKNISNFACQKVNLYGPKYVYDLKLITESKTAAKYEAARTSVKALMIKIKSSFKKTNHKNLNMG